MSERLESLINSNLGKKVLAKFGAATAQDLPRHSEQDTKFFYGKLLLGAAPNAELLDTISAPLQKSGIAFSITDACAAQFKNDLASPQAADERYDALVFDASGCKDSLELVEAYRFFKDNLRALNKCGRVLIVGRPHMQASTPEEAATQRALEGLSRSLAKEVGGKGATAQLITIASGAENNASSSIRFVLSKKSAYINAQVIRVRAAQVVDDFNWQKPLQGKVALVTGASRGIGQAIAETLARDGATVLGVDIPMLADDLAAVMKSINGKALNADITAADAPTKIAAALAEMGGADLIVHNAGITRDKTIANMKEENWQLTLDINLAAAQRITKELLSSNAINDGGSIIGVSSMNGIAGQRGQTNYSASKAGVIGYVDYMAKSEELADKNITVNAVAPGFIETAMTAAIPFMTRTFGRRLNSLSQGGLPLDVAETIAFFGNPASRGVSGNTVRVCGQSWFGA